MAREKYQTAQRRFVMVREEDVSGVSGTGVVAEGCLHSNGWVSFTWLTHLQSLVWYPSLEVLESVHGHEGKSKIVFIDKKKE